MPQLKRGPEQTTDQLYPTLYRQRPHQLDQLHDYGSVPDVHVHVHVEAGGNWELAAADARQPTPFRLPGNTAMLQQMHLQPAAPAGPSNPLGQVNMMQQPQQQHDQAAAPRSHQPNPATFQQHQDWGTAVAEVLRLLPRLNQEYKIEMQLLLRACQVAGRVAKYSSLPAGALLMLDPAAKEQLQRQVLSNCNEKHAACLAAFRLAAQATAAAAANSVTVGKAARAVAQVAEAFDLPDGDNSSTSDLAAREEAAAAQAAKEAVAEALQQLRATYHQELVAATSALFAICRGFGQANALAAASCQPIKQALCVAQQQHLRVEQLWQDLLLAAACSAN